MPAYGPKRAGRLSIRLVRHGASPHPTRMKIALVLPALLAIATTASAESLPQSVKGRKLTEVNLISPQVLKRSISPKFYETLLVSPIEGLVVVRAQLSGTRPFGERIVRSDVGGRFDRVALDTARNMQITGDYKIDTQIKASGVRLHLLIYEIADGTMALYYATLDKPGGDQHNYYGSAKLAVLRKDGSWVEIKGPANLKNLAVRDPAQRNNFKTQMMMEQIGGPSAAAQGAIGSPGSGPGR